MYRIGVVCAVGVFVCHMNLFGMFGAPNALSKQIHLFVYLLTHFISCDSSNQFHIPHHLRPPPRPRPQPRRLASTPCPLATSPRSLPRRGRRPAARKGSSPCITTTASSSICPSLGQDIALPGRPAVSAIQVSTRTPILEVLWGE